MVTKNYDTSFKRRVEDFASVEEYNAVKKSYDDYMSLAGNSSYDFPHITFGGGLRFIMNENFIVAFEYGMPLSRFSKNPYIKNQDGNGAFYINTGFLF